MLQRFDEAASVLERAGPAALDDTDAALTKAYLLARAQQYEAAVAMARSAMPRLEGQAGVGGRRAELAVEVARWSMARGPDGLPDAVAILREVAALGSPDSMTRATLALALAREGHADEAREVARTGALPSPYAGTSLFPRGALVAGEPDAAVGVALELAGRGREAVDPLSRASSSVPAPWRAQVNEALATARRAAGANTGTTPGGVGAAGRRRSGAIIQLDDF
jgi:Flp pilus assembly protein TadD